MGRNNAMQHRWFRPVGALVFALPFPGALPQAITFCPIRGGIARVQRRLRFHAPCGSGPKAHKVKAQGIALGGRGHPINKAPTGRNNAVQHRWFRPVRALVFALPFPGALPQAITFCPVGAESQECNADCDSTHHAFPGQRPTR